MMMDFSRLQTEHPRDLAREMAYLAAGLITTARVALENDAGGSGSEHKEAAVAQTLEMVEAMMGVVIDGIEFLQRQCRQEGGA